VTVVGHAAEISAGEWITRSGSWVTSREHGQGVKADFLRSSTPPPERGLGRCHRAARLGIKPAA
jgi:hypothetical protein